MQIDTLCNVWLKNCYILYSVHTKLIGSSQDFKLFWNATGEIKKITCLHVCQKSVNQIIGRKESITFEILRIIRKNKF